jgi:hypothetical protein
MTNPAQFCDCECGIVDSDVAAIAGAQNEPQMSIWTILFVVLLVAWIGGFTMFHVAGGLLRRLLPCVYGNWQIIVETSV